MNLKAICEKRYSVRTFLSQEIEKKKIDYILRCAQLAPSAANFQPWFFYVIAEKNVQKEIHQCYDRPWFSQAPLYIVVCKDTSQSWKRPDSDGKDHSDIDAAIAASHIYLAAHELGLGVCWVCNFNPPILKNALKIGEDHIVPIAIFPIGYIDEEKSKVPNKKRKDISEITYWM